MNKNNESIVVKIKNRNVQLKNTLLASHLSHTIIAAGLPEFGCNELTGPGNIVASTITGQRRSDDPRKKAFG